MTSQQLYQNIKTKRSFLCVGLDTDIKKIPQHLLQSDDPVFEFNRQIVDATAEFCVSYKPNTAFYEAQGAKGWESLEKTIAYIRKNYPQQFIIADAKRGDIGNTAQLYARSFFEAMPCDAVTLSPYMGADSVQPFLAYPDKWAVILALTSNSSSKDFQLLPQKNNDKLLFEQIIATSQQWGTPDNIMYVVGATQAVMLQQIRRCIPHHFLLIPGVGAQGGSLEEVVKYGMNEQCGLLVNSSRAIIYADSSENFAQASAQAAKEVQQEMAKYLNEK